MNNSTDVERIYLAPLELAHLIPPPEYDVMILLLLLYVGIAPIGAITNTLICVILIKSGLVKNSAYSMIFSVSMANALFCLYGAVFQTAGIIIDG